MQVPIIKLSEYSQAAVQKIFKASKGKIPLSQQEEMANYYGYLLSQSQTDLINHAKLFIGK